MWSEQALLPARIGFLPDFRTLNQWRRYVEGAEGALTPPPKNSGVQKREQKDNWTIEIYYYQPHPRI